MSPTPRAASHCVARRASRCSCSRAGRRSRSSSLVVVLVVVDVVLARAEAARAAAHAAPRRCTRRPGDARRSRPIGDDAPAASSCARRNRPTSRSSPRSRRGAARRARSSRGRRGAHELPPVAARRTGPLGLGRARSTATAAPSCSCTRTCSPRSASCIALRRGRFRDPGLRTRGPLGLGTEFESVRDYLPDDDVRQINWQATGAYRTADEQPVPHRAGPRRRVPPRRGPVDGAPPIGRSAHPRSTRRSTRSPWSRSSPTSWATGAASPSSTPRSGAGSRRAAAAGEAVVQAILDVEPATRRQRPRPRVPSGRRRQARARRRVHRSRRRSRGRGRSSPRCRCSRAGTRSSSRRCATPISTRDGRAMPSDAARRVRGRDRARRARRARTRRGTDCGTAGATVIEAPPALLGEACVGAVPTPQGARAPLTSPVREPGAPRHEHQPQKTTPRPKPTTSTVGQARARRGEEPFDKPATTSHAAVPSTISTAARASSRSACPRGRVAGIDDRPADPQPRRARHDDAAQLEHAVRGDELEERVAVARADREARDRAEQHAVVAAST